MSNAISDALNKAAEDFFLATYGMTVAQWAALSFEERSQLAYDRGQGFASTVPAKTPDGSLVYSQDAKVRPFPGVDLADVFDPKPGHVTRVPRRHSPERDGDEA